MYSRDILTICIAASLLACGDGGPDKSNGLSAPEPVLRAAWDVSVSEVDFGRVEQHRDEVMATVGIRNVGEATSGPVVAKLGGFAPEEFYISLDETCRGERLEIGEECELHVRMHVIEIGRFTATLIMTAGEGTIGVVPLAGEVFSNRPDSLSIMPRSLSFGRVKVGEQSAIREIVIERQRRRGDEGMPVVRMGVNGDEFSIVRNSCATQGFTIGDRCTVGVRFAPTTEGSSRTSMYVDFAEAEINALLSGDGWSDSETEPPPPTSAELRISPNAFQFGTMQMEHTFTVANIGDEETGELSVTLDGLDPSQFALTTNECVGTLAGMAECSIGVRWAPTSFAEHTAGLLVEATPGGFARASLDAR